MPKNNPDAFLPLRSNWFHILLCLVEGEQHGYGIMQNVLARSDGKVRLWPATLYGSLRRLIEAGLIVESGDRPAPEFDDARRRYYKLTTLGASSISRASASRTSFAFSTLDAGRRRARERLGDRVQATVSPRGAHISLRVPGGLW